MLVSCNTLVIHHQYTENKLGIKGRWPPSALFHRRKINVVYSISSHTKAMLKVVDVHGYDGHDGLPHGVRLCSVGESGIFLPMMIMMDYAMVCNCVLFMIIASMSIN